MTTHGDHGEGRVDVAVLDINAILARVDTDYDRFQIVLIDDFDALIGEIQCLRAENARLREALFDISEWSVHPGVRKRARRALGAD